MSGQCKCRTQTYGRECDQCESGSWNYPNCQRCVCHGHTDTCDSHTGVCLNCQGFTEGPNCDRCVNLELDSLCMYEWVRKGIFGQSCFANNSSVVLIIYHEM